MSELPDCVAIKCPYCKSRKGEYKVFVDRRDGSHRLKCLSCGDVHNQFVSNKIIACDWFQIDR